MEAVIPIPDARSFREAGLLLGGERNLSEFLDIEVWLLSRWLEGLGQPPGFVLSRRIDLIESRKPRPKRSLPGNRRSPSIDPHSRTNVIKTIVFLALSTLSFIAYAQTYVHPDGTIVRCGSPDVNPNNQACNNAQRDAMKARETADAARLKAMQQAYKRQLQQNIDDYKARFPSTPANQPAAAQPTQAAPQGAQTTQQPTPTPKSHR